MLVAAGGLFVTAVMVEVLANTINFKPIPGKIESRSKSRNVALLHEKAESVAVKITKYPIKSAYQKSFRKAVTTYVRNSLDAKDNIMSEVYYERESPATLWVIERWSNQAALTANNQRQPAKAIQRMVSQATSSPVETIMVRDLEPIPKGSWRKTPNPEDRPFTIMLFVDAKNGTENKFKEIYHKAMPQIRGESGIVTYQLSQRTDDDTKFITYEKFRNQEAFQYHLKFAPLKPVLDYLHSSIKSPPFEKGLHNLIPIDQ
ncbi:hypothetical protein GCM10028805_57960 [Spirosoma harenae]